MTDAEVALFQGLSAEEQRKVRSLGQEISFAKGDHILPEEKPATDLFIILEGCVSIQKSSEEGRELLALLEAGDHFGELAMADPSGPASAAAVAADEARVLVIPHDALRRFMDSDPVVATRLLWNLLGILARRLRSTDRGLVFARSLVEKYRGMPGRS